MKISLGTWITVAHPTVVELMAKERFDWLCVDLEHSPVDKIELQTSVAMIQSHRKKAYVRVAENSHTAIKYPLDTGSDGVIIPMVNSFEDAHRALSSCLYPPKGKRGVGLSRAQGFGFDFENHLKQNLEELDIILQVEHIDAVDCLEDILSLDGVSGVFLGPYDLSGSMGIPGQFDPPRMQKAIERVSSKTLEYGKKLGVHVIPADASEVTRYEKMGYNFIAFSMDTLFLGSKISDELKKLNQKRL